MTELDLTYVDQTIERLGGGAESLIPYPAGDPGALPRPAARAR